MTDYKPKWVCNECGSSDVQSLSSAWFDPNNDLQLIDCVEDWQYDWCNECECETSLDECEENYEKNNTHKPTCDT